MSQYSRHMQKTIPQLPREQIQTQTDLNLLGRQLGSSNVNVERIPLRLADMCSEHGLLQPFSDYYLYSQLQQLISKMKKDAESEVDESKQQKMLQYLSNQINGLLKRELRMEGSKSSYYELLGEKDKEILSMEIRHSSFESKLRKSNQKIAQLERQIIKLRSALGQMQNAAEENAIYQQCFGQMTAMLKESRKLTDIESFLNEKISPLLKQTEQRFQTIAKNAARDRRSKVKGMLGQYTKQLHSFYLDPNLTFQSLSESISAFYSNLEHIHGDNWIRHRIGLSSQYQNLKNHQNSLISLLNRNVQQILTENPSLKTLRQFQQFMRIIEDEQRNGVQTMIVNGWVSVGKADGRVVQVPVQDAKTKEMIRILSAQFKKIIGKYPQIKGQLSATFLEFISLDVLEDTVEVDAFDRLKEIVVYKSDVLKVENVYNYTSKSDKDLIFHLRILIKSLLEELEVIRKKYRATITLDEGIIGMLNEQILQGVDASAIISLYRPQPKIVEVQKIVDRPVYMVDEIQQGVPIRAEKGVYGQRIIEQPVIVEKSVPIEVQKPVPDTVKEFVEVRTMSEVPVQVPTTVEKIVDRIVIDEKLVEVVNEKLVPYREQIKEIVRSQVEKIVREPEIIEKEVPVELWKQTIRQIEKYVDKPVYLYKQSERAVQVPIIKELFYEKPVYIQVQKKMPYVVRTPEIHQLIKEVPKIIMETTQIIKPVPEILEKIVQVAVQKDPQVLQVPVTIEKQLIKEIEKEIIVEMTHFVKPDRQEIIKEVEVFVDKPIIQEVIVSKNLQIEKATPMYIREEKPIYVEVKVPYIKPEVKPIDLVVEKPVFLKEEVIKQVRVQVPVPIILEKEIVKVQECIKEKVVEKIVEVPRVEVVEKIVEKVVVVPRIIEKIVEVPQIVEKCVVVERPILELAEIPRQIAVERKVQVPKIVQISQQVFVDNPIYQEMQVEVPVERVIEREIPVEIQIEKRIPHQVIKEVPVDVFRDRIVEKIVEINEVQVKDREVQIPLIVEQPVHILQEKPVLHQKTVESIIKVPQTIEKLVPTEKIIDRVKEIHLKEEVPIERDVLVEVPGQSVIRYEKEYETVDVTQEKIVQVRCTEEIAREVFLEVEKIVPLNVEKIINVPEVQYLAKPELIEISHPVHHINYKQVPVVLENTRHIPTRTILQEIKEIEVQIQKAISVTVQKEKIIKCVQNIKEWCTKEVPKDVVQEVPVREGGQTIVREIEVEKLIEPLKHKIVQIQEEEKSIEKVVEKIVMLPQLVEIVKTVHEISEVQALGVAKDVSSEVHTKEYVGLTQDLRAQLSTLLGSFKSKVRSQPDLKVLIDNIEKYLVILDTWVKFPKIIQVPREVEVIVEKDRPVLVPTKDSEKEIALMSIIEQLITGLRKFRKEDIKRNFSDQILNIFFMDLDLELSKTSLESKYTQYIHEMREKYRSFGSWADNHAMVLNSFLQTRFAMSNIIEESNKSNYENREKISELERKLDELAVCNMINELAKEKAASDYANLVKNLVSLTSTYEFLESIISHHTSILSPQEYFNEIKESKIYSTHSYQVTHSRQEFERPEEELTSILVEKDKEISSIIVKLSTAEKQRQEVQRIRGELERENENLRYELQIMRERLEGDANKSVINIQEIQMRINGDWERRVQNLQEQYERETERLRTQIKSHLAEGSSNSELTNENRRLIDEVRSLKRQYENFKKTQDSAHQNSENQRKRLIDEYEKKIKNMMENSDREKKREIDNVRRSSETSQQTFQLAKQRLVDDYERKIKTLNENLEKAKTSPTVRKEVTAEQGSEVRKLRDQIRKLEIELDTSKRQIEAYQKARLGQTTYTSGFKHSMVEEFTSPRHDPYKSVEVERQAYKSPQSEEGSLQGSRISRESKESRGYMRKYEGEEIHSSSSRVSGRSSSSGFKTSMTMKELMEVNSEQKSAISTLLMIKIIERIEEEANRGIVNCYTPANIYLSNFNLNNIDSLIVRFGAPANKKSKYDGLYYPPEVHRGQNITIKSVVFCLGVIWDQLIHSQIYYKTISEIENLSHEFKVRDAKLNPILKNTLFEMMSKDGEKRLELNEVKRRLSLQKYIAAEGGRVITTSSRVSEQSRKQ